MGSAKSTRAKKSLLVKTLQLRKVRMIKGKPDSKLKTAINIRDSEMKKKYLSKDSWKH